jgi:hypothetical protein
MPGKGLLLMDGSVAWEVDHASRTGRHLSLADLGRFVMAVGIHVVGIHVVRLWLRRSKKRIVGEQGEQ